MVRGREREERSTKEHENGLAHDKNIKPESSFMKSTGVSKQQAKGFLSIAAGTLLFIYTLGYFPILNWVVMAGSIGLILFGGKLLDLWNKIAQGIEYIRDRYFNKKDK